VARRKEEPPVDVTLPITPMLDMSFQLLSFFVVTFRPPSQEGQLSVDLPKLDAAASPTDPISEDTIKDEYTITVNGDSEIRSISLKGLTITEKPVADTGSLYQQLKVIADSKGANAGTQVSITIEADDRLVYSKLIEVMDVCKKAGFESMSMKPNRPRGGS
jgi:biopolymer transport protein ExbD